MKIPFLSLSLALLVLNIVAGSFFLIVLLQSNQLIGVIQNNSYQSSLSIHTATASGDRLGTSQLVGVTSQSISPQTPRAAVSSSGMISAISANESESADNIQKPQLPTVYRIQQLQQLPITLDEIQKGAVEVAAQEFSAFITNAKTSEYDPKYSLLWENARLKVNEQLRTALGTELYLKLTSLADQQENQ